MSRVLTQNLSPGMITAEDVYSYNNQLIIAKGGALTDKIITKLEFYSVLSVKIKDGKDDDSLSEAPAAKKPKKAEKQLSYSENIKASPEFKKFSMEFNKSLGEFRTSINDLVLRHTADADKLLENTDRLLAGNPSGIHVFDMLHNMRSFDDPTFAHSLNVALICNVFGKWLGINKDDLRVLTLSGLLHDVGKLKIPEDIITKPSKLTNEEFSLIKTHAVEGFNVLQPLDLDERIKNAALMHHERCDGSGYPFGLTHKEIDPFARIVAIADVYDAMTSKRVYRGPLCPFRVIEIFENEGLQKYDPEYILIFLEYIVNTYMNNRVKLSNGAEGDVVLINKLNLSRPMIRCGNHYVDLSREHNLTIEAII
ncbi:HD-GYP domain-containing protein [Lachnospiraceae bacterium C1.1]|nr:HD-GYP domain-containing protein [Lachnospiraceae bacterium C1.1]